MQSMMAVERTLVIKAARERVWDAITQDTQISQWFDGRMKWEFEPLSGEKMTFYWDGKVIGCGKVVTADKPERFAFHWTPEPGNPVESLVTFVLEAVAEGTRLTITEAGFEALPEGVRQRRRDMNGEGWGITLEHLTAYLQAGDHA